MSFTGDLEHLPIVDIIQLLHAARKSGTLTIHNPRGDNQLVFADGGIVSAKTSRNTSRLGRVLLETGAIDQGALEAVAAAQQAEGVAGKPLLAVLMEKGLAAKEGLFKALETFIEKAVLEVLIWKEGTFTFDVDVVNLADEYRYCQETLQHEVHLNSQSVLMEALRLYDEKKRDGVLESEFADESAPSPATVAAAVAAAAEAAEAAEASATAQPVASLAPAKAPAAPSVPSAPPEPAADQDEFAISADILGLADLERLERKIPDVFVGLADPEPPPGEKLRSRLAETAAQLPPAEREAIAVYLEPLLAAGEAEGGSGSVQTVILFSPDPLLAQALSVICKRDGLLAFSTTEAQDLDMILAQSQNRRLQPLLIFDRPTADGAFSAVALKELRQQLRAKAPQAQFLQLTAPADVATVYGAHVSGARLTLPRPLPEPAAGFARKFNGFLQALRSSLQEWTKGVRSRHVEALVETCRALKSLSEPRDVALELLKFVAGVFPRALILVVGQGELVVDRGRGLDSFADSLIGARIPLAADSLLAEVCNGGRLFFSPASDPLLAEQLQRMIGLPSSPQLLLLPVTSFGKVRVLIYADFARRTATEVPLPLLEILAGEGGLVLENALYRKKLQKDPL